MFSLVRAFLTHFTYIALMAVLIVAGMGVPIPEDIPLVFSGYLCNDKNSPIAMIDTDGDTIPDAVTSESSRRTPHLWLMILSGMIGVVAGDSIVFHIGRKGVHGDNLVCRHIRKVMHSQRREKVEKHFAKHGGLTVFAGRFMPGFRSLIFAFAGMSRMSYLRFVLIDGIAAAISVPTFILLGWHFAANINVVLDWIARIKHILLPVICVLVVGAIALYLVRRRRAPAL